MSEINGIQRDQGSFLTTLTTIGRTCKTIRDKRKIFECDDNIIGIKQGKNRSIVSQNSVN
jgi:hypothetical protein